MKKFRIIIFIYIITRLVLAILGAWGDQDIHNKELLLHYFTASDITTSQTYFLHGLVPFTIYHIMIIMLLWFLFTKNYDTRLAVWLQKYTHSDYLLSFCFFSLYFTGIFVIRLPFILYAGYYRDSLFNLMNANFTTWLLRLFASSFITIILMAIAISLIVVMIKKCRFYLLYLPLTFFMFAILYAIFYPRLIMPLFYKTVPISNTYLAKEINSLAEKAKINVNDIRILNTGKYNLAINAHFIGLGSEKNIYLYNTLFDNFDTQEILSVVSHEIGHYKENHVLIGIILASLGISIFFICINCISLYCFQKKFQELMRENKYLAAVMLASTLLFFTNPIENSISRIMEKRADTCALQLTNNPRSSISMRIKSARRNKLRLLPHPFYRWFYYSHPSALQRITHAENYRRE